MSSDLVSHRARFLSRGLLALLISLPLPASGDDTTASQTGASVIQLTGLEPPETATEDPGAAAEKPVPADPNKARRAEVEKLIRYYFSTWSHQDIDAYGECFLSGAVVQYVDSRGRVQSSSLRPFLSSQRDAHRNASSPMVEIPVKIDISFAANIATVSVFWKLTDGSQRAEYGYDHFTLSRATGKWKIVNLVYYSVAAPR